MNDFSHLTHGQTGAVNPFLDDDGNWRKGAVNPWIDANGMHKLDRFRPWSERRGEWQYAPELPYMGKSGKMTMTTWKVWYEGKEKFQLNMDGKVYTLVGGCHWTLWPIRPSGLSGHETEEYFKLPELQRCHLHLIINSKKEIKYAKANARNSGPDRPAHMGTRDMTKIPEHMTHNYYLEHYDQTVERFDKTCANYMKFYGDIPDWV